MARVDTLPHFLTDVADAIREKKGTNETITASDFDTEIENLPSGGDINEYLNTTISTNTGQFDNFSTKVIKKIPNVTVTSNVTSLAYAFKGSTNLADITFSNENDTSNVTDMRYMFASHLFTKLDLRTFNTGKVTDMQLMFSECRQLAYLDLSSFDTSRVTNMSTMFSSCTSLMHLDIRNFTFDNVTSYDTMFGSTVSSTWVPSNCEIIVKSQTEKDWINTNFSRLTNVKTVAEYEAEQNT